MQSVFLKVWENHRKIDRELSFRSYLFTIAYNDICKIFRRRSYLQKYVMETLYENTRATSASEEGGEYQSVLDEVQRLIGSLPENQRQAFIMSRIEGKPSREVAAELGITAGTVDNYVSGTLKIIRGKTQQGEPSRSAVYLAFSSVNCPARSESQKYCIF